MVSDTCVSSPVVAVVGVGYVGEHLVLEFSKHYPTIAYDIDARRLDQISQHKTTHQLMTTRDPSDLRLATHILISVPTGVFHDGAINVEILRNAVATVVRNARFGATIVVESSVAVGMTRDLFGDIYLERELKIGMSPERVDPGRTDIAYDAIPKVISGIDQRSLSSITRLYQPVFPKLVPVSTLEVAEMTKLYENTQRMLNIAFANEMADACLSHKIDPIEVCKAAGTKPFGYMPYTPSLGVGGHCIPVNPYYLLSNTSWPCLEQATKKMRSRPADIGDRIMAELLEDISSRRPRILVVGASFKKGQSVLSNAPGIDLIVHLLSTYDVYVEFADPLVEEAALSYLPKYPHETEWNADSIDSSFDAVVVAIAQVGLDFEILQQLRMARVFNFTTALPWSSPALLQRPGQSRHDSRMSSISSASTCLSEELEPATPIEFASLRFLAGAVFDEPKTVAKAVAEPDKVVMKVLVEEMETDDACCRVR